MMWGSTILLPLILLFYLMFQLFNFVYIWFRCQLVPEAEISGEKDEAPLSAFYQDGKIG